MTPSATEARACAHRIIREAATLAELLCSDTKPADLRAVLASIHAALEPIEAFVNEENH